VVLCAEFHRTLRLESTCILAAGWFSSRMNYLAELFHWWPSFHAVVVTCHNEHHTCLTLQHPHVSVSTISYQFFFEGTISYQINSLPNWVNSKPIILNNYYSRDQWFTFDSSIHHGHDRGFDLALQLCQLSLKAWSTKWPDLSMLPPHPASRAKRNQHKKGRRLDSGDKSR
jgi:hypothetical protein